MHTSGHSVRINRQRLRLPPYAKFSEVSHAESFVARVASSAIVLTHHGTESHILSAALRAARKVGDG